MSPLVMRPWGVSVERMPWMTPLRATSRALSISTTWELTGRMSPLEVTSRLNWISSEAVSCAKPMPTLRTEMISPSTSRPAGKIGVEPHSGDWMSTARTEVPGLELYEATGSRRRTQNDLPEGMYSQLAEAGTAKDKARRRNRQMPNERRRPKRKPREVRFVTGMTINCSVLDTYTLSGNQSWTVCLQLLRMCCSDSVTFAKSATGTAYRGSGCLRWRCAD